MHGGRIGSTERLFPPSLPPSLAPLSEKSERCKGAVAEMERKIVLDWDYRL